MGYGLNLYSYSGIWTEFLFIQWDMDQLWIHIVGYGLNLFNCIHTVGYVLNLYSNSEIWTELVFIKWDTD